MSSPTRLEPVLAQHRTDVGRRLQTLRRDAGLTAVELANKVGITAHTLSRIEVGAADPKVATKLAIARALNVEPGDLWPLPSLAEIGAAA